jgi:hypothetical protein
MFPIGYRSHSRLSAILIGMSPLAVTVVMVTLVVHDRIQGLRCPQRT